LYGPGRSPEHGSLVAPHNVIGLPDKPDVTDILSAVKTLFEDGVRRICVSLDGNFPDNGDEREIAAVVEGQYPDHYLGAVPVLMGGEMAQVHDDAPRTHCPLINAHPHPRLPPALLQAGDPGAGAGAGTGPIRLGPDSTGAAPGPACYGLGGDQATVTDAFLVLGYLDPTRFHGGRRTLDVARSEEVLSKQLAAPLGIS